MHAPSLDRFSDRDQLASHLADAIAASLDAAVTQHDGAVLAVSGGTTPKPLFGALAHRTLPWQKVTITLVDDRVVAADDPASNARLVRQHLLIGRAATATFLPLVTDLDPVRAVAAARARPELGERPFDVTVLGMGEDGHVASLFPDMPGWEAALDPHAPPALVAGVAPVPPTRRISHNLASLLRSRRLILHITGEPKRRLLGASAGSLPITRLRSAAGDRLETWWSP